MNAAETADTAVEEIIEPELEITDAHHHLWDHHPPRYVLDDLLADTADGHRVTKTIFVESGWRWDKTAEPARFAPVGEVTTIAGLAAESRRRGGARISKIVAHADLREGDEAAGVLDRLIDAGDGLVAGIRHCATWDPSPEIPAHPHVPGPHLLGDPAFRRGFRQLASFGLSFDVWAYHTQLADTLALARDFPDVPIIVDHFGGPLGLGPYAGQPDEVRARWQDGMAKLAGCENVFVKLGGIGMPMIAGFPQDGQPKPTSAELAARWRPYLTWCVERFSAERCMFESNFPVDSRWCSYRVAWNALKRIAADASPAEKAALFSGTAERVYQVTDAAARTGQPR